MDSKTNNYKKDEKLHILKHNNIKRRQNTGLCLDKTFSLKGKTKPRAEKGSEDNKLSKKKTIGFQRPEALC